MKHFFPYVHRELAGRAASFAFAAFTLASTAWADEHTTGVPVLNSRPGATYTVYLNPAGFNYDGTWLGSTPGNNPALNGVPSNGVFSPADVTEIMAIWAAAANKFQAFNINVTTVDPYDALNDPTPTDLERRNYYDSQPHMMHTVIGVGNGWQGGNDGLAGGGTIDTIRTVGSGEHTNWMFTNAQNGVPTVANGNYIGTIAAHETGHTFGLNHQSDFTGGVVVNENGLGDDASGNGTYDGIMGNADARQRIAWRVGSSVGAPGNFRNDVKRMMENDSLAYADSGIGHTFATATPLPLVGNAIDVNDPLHRGVITPLSATDPNPIGAGNYTTDFFSFMSDGFNPITLTLNDGNDFLVPGIADNGLTLRSSLSIFDSTFSLIGTGTEDASTLLDTFGGLLASGTYYARISSFGGHNEVTANFDAAQYYDMGGYFVTGSGFVVPEPSSVCFLTVGFGLIVTRRWRRRERASE